MCGRWYLPMFLLRDGSLTLIYRASLMVLMRFWLSPYYFKIFYVDVMTSGVMMVIYGGWGLLVFFEPLSKISGGFPYILLIHFIINENIFPYTFCVYKNCWENIFFRPEEAMFENWQKLVSSYKIDLVQEKITFDSSCLIPLAFCFLT